MQMAVTSDKFITIGLINTSQFFFVDYKLITIKNINNHIEILNQYYVS